MWTYTDPTGGNDVNAIQALDGTDAASLSIVNYVYTLPPAPAITSAPILDPGSDSGTVGDAITADTTPTVTGTADANATVRLYDSDGTTLLGTATADGSGNWSITSSALAEGVHRLKVTQTNSSSQTSGFSSALSVTIDTTAPAAPITAPALALVSQTGIFGTAANMTGVAAPTITGTTTPNGVVALYDTDGTTLLGTATADGLGVYSIVSSTLSDGFHSLTVKAVDGAGNTSTASPGLGLNIDTTLPPGPSTTPVLDASFDSGTPGDNITNVAAPQINGSGAQPFAILALYDTDGTTVLATAMADGSGNYILFPVLTEGVHNLTVKALDLAGNVSTSSQSFTLTIDTTPPAVTAGSSGAGRIAGDGDPNAVVTILEGNTTIGTAIADGQGHWTFAPQGLAAGLHTLAVSETDAAGNTSTVEVALQLDPQPAAGPTDFITSTPTSIGIARFFDMTNGTQFFTSSVSEYNAILANRPDLKLENNDLNALNPDAAATDPNATPVYRFFDTTYGTHFFTSSADERDQVIASRPDLTFEGVSFFEHNSQQAGDTAVYRFFESTNGTHFYTASETERASILSTRPDLIDEGIGFYAPKTG